MAESPPSLESTIRTLQPAETPPIQIGLMEKHLRIYWDCEKEGEYGLLMLQSKVETFTAFSIAAFFFFLFLELQFFFSTPFEVAFLFLFSFHIYDIVISNKRYRVKKTKSNRSEFLAVLLESLCASFFEMLIMIDQRVGKFDYWFSIFFILGAYLCRLFLIGNLHSEFCSIVKAYKNIFKITFIFGVLFTFLRVDMILRISWSYALWPFWGNFCLTGLLAIALIFLTAMTGCHFVSGRVQSIEFFVALWALYTTAGYSFTVAIVLMSILKFTDDDKSTPLLQVYVVPLFYFPLLVIMSLILIIKLRAHRKKIEFDKKMNNPIERAKIAFGNWKNHYPTGYPQSHVFPKYIVPQ